MNNDELKIKAQELYQGGLGYVAIAAELGLDRDKVRRLLGRKNGGGGLKPWKIHVPLGMDLISASCDTQMRVSISQSTVDEYAEAMRDGANFPAVSVFTNGLSYWLADGFHRVLAAEAAGIDTITADIYKGTLRDAKLYAMGANANHGLRRTNADKRRAVEIALSDAEWRELPNTEIANMCAVAESFVRKIKTEREAEKAPAQNSHNANHGIPAAESPERDAEPASVQDAPRVENKRCAANPAAHNVGRRHKVYNFLFEEKCHFLKILPMKGNQLPTFNSRGELEGFIKELERYLAMMEEWGDDVETD
jgi:hypothetical protein